jgi:hypothetical protein
VSSERDPVDPPPTVAAGVDEPLVRRLDDTPTESTPTENRPATAADEGDLDSSPASEVHTASSAEAPPVSAGPVRSRHEPSPNMLPARSPRSRIESFVVRLIATCGVVAIGVAIAAIMVSDKSHGWLVGLVVSIVSVVLAALLWSSRQL